MSHFADPIHIEYDEWFDENIYPRDLLDYLNENEFSYSVHEKFYRMLTLNLTIGSCDNFYK